LKGLMLVEWSWIHVGYSWMLVECIGSIEFSLAIFECSLNMITRSSVSKPINKSSR
jgi:hypothetical protein